MKFYIILLTDLILFSINTQRGTCCNNIAKPSSGKDVHVTPTEKPDYCRTFESVQKKLETPSQCTDYIENKTLVSVSVLGSLNASVMIQFQKARNGLRDKSCDCKNRLNNFACNFVYPTCSFSKNCVTDFFQCHQLPCKDYCSTLVKR